MHFWFDFACANQYNDPYEYVDETLYSNNNNNIICNNNTDNSYVINEADYDNNRRKISYRNCNVSTERLATGARIPISRSLYFILSKTQTIDSLKRNIQFLFEAKYIIYRVILFDVNYHI